MLQVQESSAHFPTVSSKSYGSLDFQPEIRNREGLPSARCGPHPPIANANVGITLSPEPQPFTPALRNSPSDSSTSLSIGCPLIINALMPLHYIVGFENLKYG